MNTQGSLARMSQFAWLGLISVLCIGIAGCPQLFPGLFPPPDGGEDGGTAKPTYVGSEQCAQCHQDIYDTFLQTGHPYKISKVENGQVPTFPFSDITGALELIDDDDQPLADNTPDPHAGTDNSLGTPQSYDDISYIIGGYGWKVRWIDLDGYIVTGSNVQYNLETQATVAYHNNETDKPFNCGNCHTTGWKAYTSQEGDDRNLNRQDDLPGMAGTFAYTGIQCEACHGAGSEHVADPSEDNITRVATPRTTADFLADDMGYGLPVACSECHTRDGEMDYPDYVGGPGLIKAKGGLIRHHEQYDELLGLNPDNPTAGADSDSNKLAHGLTCTTCHDPHKTVIYQDEPGVESGIKLACTTCHADKEITTGGMQNLECIDCHMPYLAKSALAHDPVGTGPATGDIRSHIFRIDLTQTDQFTADGSYAYPWITATWACKTCHNGVDAFDMSTEALSTFTIHD